MLTLQEDRVVFHIHGGGFGNFIENNAIDRFVLQRPAVLEQLGEMPGDGFSLAVRVSSEVQGIGPR